MRVAFFGGSFDPPHRGHLAIARAAAEAFSLDRVLLAPTALQPLKPLGPDASFADRLAMVRLLCAGSDLPQAPLEASAIDAPTAAGTPNFTIDTLRRLRQTLAPDDSLFVIAGADAFLDLPHWREPAALLDIAQWIVVSRPGSALSAALPSELPSELSSEFSEATLAALAPLALTPDQRARIHLLTTVDDPASATAIRAILRSGTAELRLADDATALLPPAVLHYIREHHLYST
jgi:nicotinate-nucleotide adenylyltransferase